MLKMGVVRLRGLENSVLKMEHLVQEKICRLLLRHPAVSASTRNLSPFSQSEVAAARDAYLPPQRQRYAFLSDKLLLSPLRVEVSDVWSLIISHGGCPDCVMKFKEETSVQDALAMQCVINL